MTKVFIIIPWFHPAFRAGGPVQSIANMVNQFTGNCYYKIFCGHTDLNNEPLEGIETGKWIRYNAQTEVWYANTTNRTRTLKKIIREERPDVLFMVGIYSWVFNMFPLLFCQAPKKILSVRGMLHPGALSQKAGKKRIFISLLRNLLTAKNIFFHATDEAEKKFIQSHMGQRSKIYIAGNYPRIFSPDMPVQKQPNHLSLVSIALISAMKNHLLVLQALQKCTGFITYHIYGPIKDSEYWQLCLQKVKELPSNIQVQYHGEVHPQLIEAALKQSHVFILPSKSENFGHAIYEALTAGKPVITSHGTPWQNLQEQGAGINVALHVRELQAAITYFADMDQTTYEVAVTSAATYAYHAIQQDTLHQQYSTMLLGSKNINDEFIKE